MTPHYTIRERMAHQPEIWTGDVRRVLYKRLVQLFGAWDKWEKRGSPGRGLDTDFEKFCDIFAQVVGARSGDAVKHQIHFAIPETESGSTWKNHAQTAILNKAIALECGFIRDQHLPDILAIGRGHSKKVPLTPGGVFDKNTDAHSVAVRIGQ